MIEISLHAFVAPRGYAAPDPPYRSRFGFVWWFWLPRLHHQAPAVMNGWHNARVVRVIWLCFAFGANLGKDGPWGYVNMTKQPHVDQ